MSQVRNLRAMFEQKGDASPPDRGREESGLSQPASPRPLSRVRANFVAVEKDGRVGLQHSSSRDPSCDSMLSRTRALSPGGDSDVAVSAAVSHGTKAAPVAARSLSEAEEIKGPAAAPMRVPALIPEEPVPLTPAATAAPRELSGFTPKVAPLADITHATAVPGVTREKSPAPTPRKLFAKLPTGGTTRNQSPSGTLASPLEVSAASTLTKAALETATSMNGTAATAKSASANSSLTNGATKGTLAAGNAMPHSRPRLASKETQKAIAAKVAANAPKVLSTTKAASASRPSVKSPSLGGRMPSIKASTTAKVPSSSGSKATSKPHEKSTIARTAATSPTSLSPRAKPPPPLTAYPPNGIGFVKPKPKSPTRPIQLPSGLTTQTASSATKANTHRPSALRQPSSHPSLQPPLPVTAASHFSSTRSPSRAGSRVPSRAPSRASVVPSSTPVGLPAGHKMLRRQSSTLSIRSRPSIGPPPKQIARDHPVTKREKEVDESFLARMMRPTQASALKAASRQPHVSPPRKLEHGVTPVVSLTSQKAGAQAKKKISALSPRAHHDAKPAVAASTPTTPEKTIGSTKEDDATPEMMPPTPAITVIEAAAVAESAKVTKSSAEESSEAPAEVSAEKPTASPVEKSPEEPVEETSETTVTKPVEEPTEEPEEATVAADMAIEGIQETSKKEAVELTAVETVSADEVVPAEIMQNDENEGGAVPVADSTVEVAAVEEPAAVESAAVEPAVEEPAVEKPATEESAVEKPLLENDPAVIENASHEQPVAKPVEEAIAEAMEDAIQEPAPVLVSEKPTVVSLEDAAAHSAAVVVEVAAETAAEAGETEQ